MTSPDHKRMRFDTPHSSRMQIQTESTFTFKICKNRKEKILELDIERYQDKPTSINKIDDIIEEVFFQDNTMAFQKVLLLEKLVLIIYPPGSGKTTMALLLESYLSSSIEWSDKLTVFFENCEYANKCRVDYDKFKKSSQVTYISFEDIRGSTRKGFEDSLIDIMLKCFQDHCSKTAFTREMDKVNETKENVYGSLKRFVMEMNDKTKTTYLLLDSCDTVYDTIAHLGDEAFDVCEQFTIFLKGAVPIRSSGVVLICFSVLPYFASKFSGKATIFHIGQKNDELGQYFSYSSETIHKVINECDLKTSYDECLKVAQFKYNNRIFINPGICVSFFRSLHLKKDHFQVNIVPRSLWLGCIFTVEDRDLLLGILHAPCEKEFNMAVSMKSFIISQIFDRKLFYLSLIYCGFISCKPLGDGNKYLLNMANETLKCIFKKILNDIYPTMYKHNIENYSEIYKMIFANKWQKFCDSLSEMLSSSSTRTFSTERDYNNWLFGLLHPAQLNGFSVKNKVTVKNNIALAGIFPDLTLSGTPRIAAVWELKYLKATILREKITEDLTLIECYSKDISENHKKIVLNEIRKELLKAKPQITQYASSYLTAEKYKSVKCFIAMFYLNHIMLFVNDYHFQSRDAANVPPSTWVAYCSDGFFSQTDLMSLMELSD